jgi:hypothetical protein
MAGAASADRGFEALAALDEDVAGLGSLAS